MGVELTDVSAATASQAGVDRSRACIITKVYSNCGAERAGLQKHDIVTGIDGRDYATESSLREAIRSRASGEQIRLTVVRGGKAQEIVVTVE